MKTQVQGTFFLRISARLLRVAFLRAFQDDLQTGRDGPLLVSATVRTHSQDGASAHAPCSQYESRPRSGRTL
jgi:hypothetical protein